MLVIISLGRGMFALENKTLERNKFDPPILWVVCLVL